MKTPASPSPAPRASAFTLVELLVVVAIIALLSALSFAAYQRVQITGQSASCASNLRTIGAAFQMYAGENDGLLPALRYRADLGGENPTEKNWQFELNPYLAVEGSSFKNISKAGIGRQIFCPTYYVDYKENTDAQKLSAGGYGMNPNLGGSVNAWDKRTPTATLPNAAQTILVGDSDDYHLNVSGSTWPDEPQPKERFISGDPIRHGHQSNYLFADGHVEAMKQEDAMTRLMTKPVQ